MRTVKYAFTQDELYELVQDTGDRTATDKAIAYLSTWAMDSEKYAYTIISGGAEGELLASYRETEHGPITYTIGAVWHGDHYGFHS